MAIVNPFTYISHPRRTARGFLVVMGRLTIDFLRAIGESWMMLAAVAGALVRDRPRREVLITQLYHIGYLSLVVVLVTGSSMGLVLAVQSYATLVRFNAEVMSGPMINYSIVSQLGPVMTALMVAGRVGSNIAAELGTMKVTEQIDALRVMGTSPLSYLVAPRVLACTALLPILGALGSLIGVVSAHVLCVEIWGVDAGAYWFQAMKYVATWDVMVGIAKCPFFGVIIGLVACRQGLRTMGGATGVGQACTRAVVQASLAVLVANFILTLLGNKLYQVLHA